VVVPAPFDHVSVQKYLRVVASAWKQRRLKNMPPKNRIFLILLVVLCAETREKKNPNPSI